MWFRTAGACIVRRDGGEDSGFSSDWWDQTGGSGTIVLCPFSCLESRPCQRKSFVVLYPPPRAGPRVGLLPFTFLSAGDDRSSSFPLDPWASRYQDTM